MIVRLYYLAVVAAAALTGCAMAMTAVGRPIAGLALLIAAVILTLAPLLFLLKGNSR